MPTPTAPRPRDPRLTRLAQVSGLLGVTELLVASQAAAATARGLVTGGIVALLASGAAFILDRFRGGGGGGGDLHPVPISIRSHDRFLR